MEKKGIFNFEINIDDNKIPPFIYKTMHIDNCLTLADFTYGSKKSNLEILQIAWDCVVNATDDLRKLTNSMDISGYQSWPSLDKNFIKLYRPVEFFHCENCTKFINNNYKNVYTGKKMFCHGDLHSGNLVLYNNEFKLIDLENMHLAPPFTDYFLFSSLVPEAHSELLSKLTNNTHYADFELDARAALMHALKVTLLLHSVTENSLANDIEICVHKTIEQANLYLDKNL
jgi:thiamine kinase-like enzyme